MAIEPIRSKSTRATVRGLIPNFYYGAQVSADGGKTWSRILRFQTTTDNTPPAAPTNLVVDVRGSSFLLEWDAPTTDANGAALQDFNDYAITVYPTGNPDAAIEQTTKSTSFEFTIYQNKHFFGTVEGSLTFEVRARDLTYNRSEPATAEGVAAGPVPFNDLVATGGPRAIKLSWANQGVTTYYRVYRSSTSTVPLTSPIATVVTESSSGDVVTYWDIPPDDEIYYYKVEAVDAFGSTAESNVASANSEGGIDTDPPATPTAPTVVGGTHSFTVTQNVVSGGNARFIHVYASATSGFAPAPANFVGTMVLPADSTTASEKFIWVVPSSQPVYVRTIAANGDGVTSPPSTQATATVALAGGTYIAEAAIGNAHIQEVSASKLMADTAINKNLNVTALLKMGTGGVIESGNWAFNTTTGKPTSGWRLTDNSFTMVGAGRFMGTIEADAGWLSNLTVRSNLTVGEAGYTGAIQSYLYNGVDNGWKINSSGSAEFRNVTVRGVVQATDGYLQSLNINGQLTLNGGSIYGYYGVNRHITIGKAGIYIYNGTTSPSMELRTDGVAIFRGHIYASDGSFSGGITSSTVSSTTITGGTIQTQATGARIVISTTNLDSVYYYNSASVGFRLSSSSGNPYFSTYNGQGIGYLDGHTIITSNNKGNYSYPVPDPLRLSGGTYNAPTYSFSAQNTTGMYYNNGLAFTVGSGTRCLIGTADFRPNTDGALTLGISTRKWGQIYSNSSTISTSDIQFKREVRDSDLGLDFVNALRPIRYIMGDGDSNRPHYGLAAQQVKEVMDANGVDFAGYIDPRAKPSENDDPEDLEVAPLGLRYEEFIAPLIKAVQELTKKVEQLEASA